MITENPMDMIERTKRNDDIKRPVLTADDLQAILKAIEEGRPFGNQRAPEWTIYRNKAIFYLFITTGMRASALSQIDVSDIDFENKQLKIIDKGHKTFTYDLDDKVIEVIQEWIQRRYAKVPIGKWTDALFLGVTGARIYPGSITDMIKNYSLIFFIVVNILG